MKTLFKYLRVRIGSTFLNNKSYYFLNGLFVAIIFYFYTENVYERQIFSAIADNIRYSLKNEYLQSIDSIVVRSLDMTYYLERRRISVFGNSQIKGFKAQFIQPVTFDLMTGRGSCASSTFVLGRILHEFNIPIRFGQMKVDGIYGGHIILEAFVNGEWKVLDAFYDLRFIRPDGNLAQFKDVQQNWSYYQAQVPPNYDYKYRYEDIQYTNWNKIPILMPVLRKILVYFTDEAFVSALSLRVYFLKKFDLLFKSFLVFLLATILLRIYIFRKDTRASIRNFPVKFIRGKSDMNILVTRRADEVKVG